MGLGTWAGVAVVQGNGLAGVLQGGGGMIDIGVHVMEMAHYVMGAPAPVTAPIPAAAAGSPQFYTSDTHAAPAQDVSSLVKQIGEAVVQVRNAGGLGSGFFLNADGYLITNFHVIEGETEQTVEVYHQNNGQLERDTYKKIKIIAINKFHDLALLKIEDKDAPKFKYVTLGSSDSLNVSVSSASRLMAARMARIALASLSHQFPRPMTAIPMPR